MTIAEKASVSRNPVERIFAALTDPSRSERTVLVLLASYAAAWSLYAAIAKSSQDLHFDVGEMFAWSHQIGWSAPTHPPLGAWLTRAWFAVMPRQDWAFYLFGILLATIALWIAWRVASRYLTPQKRVLGLALLSLLPFYNFHALKYNASSVLTPFWAATTWWFLRSYRGLRPLDAAIAGLAAAAAMLSKYWSIMLLLGLGIAALSDRRRGAYFRSAAPWITVAVGLAAMAPHLAWLYAETGKGNIDEAVRLAQGVTQKYPNMAGFLDTLGWVFYRKNLHTAAVEQLRKAVVYGSVLASYNVEAFSL